METATADVIAHVGSEMKEVPQRKSPAKTKSSREKAPDQGKDVSSARNYWTMAEVDVPVEHPILTCVAERGKESCGTTSAPAQRMTSKGVKCV